MLPYERPALTKAYLHPPGAKVRARLPGFHTCVGSGGDRQTEEFYKERGIEWKVTKVTGVDVAAKKVTTASAGTFGYGKLLFCTGSSAKRVAAFGVKGEENAGVFHVRDEGDTAKFVAAMEALQKEKGSGAKAVVLGGGYIGLECSAAMVGYGFDVTAIFMEPNVMDRLFTPQLAEWMEKQYRERGIKLMPNEAASEILGQNGKVSGVALAKSKQTLGADIVVVGVGADPNVELLKGQVQMLERAPGGIQVDGNLRTSNPDVFSFGDVAAFPLNGQHTRMEHVHHARLSAAHAVRAAMGKNPGDYAYLPYFYSRVFEYTDKPIVWNFWGDQYGGEVSHFENGSGGMGALWLKGGKAVGALLIGSPPPSAEEMGSLEKIARAMPAADKSATVAGLASKL